MATLSRGVASDLSSYYYRQGAAQQLRHSPTAMAAAAAALLASAEFDSRAGGKRPPGPEDRLLAAWSWRQLVRF